MTDAPENITLKPNHLFGNPWSNAYVGDDDPMEDGEDTSYGYTRTDVADARIAELEAELGHCIYELSRDGSQKPHRDRRAGLARKVLKGDLR